MGQLTFEIAPHSPIMLKWACPWLLRSTLVAYVTCLQMRTWRQSPPFPLPSYNGHLQDRDTALSGTGGFRNDIMARLSHEPIASSGTPHRSDRDTRIQVCQLSACIFCTFFGCDVSGSGLRDYKVIRDRSNKEARAGLGRECAGQRGPGWESGSRQHAQGRRHDYGPEP